MLETTTTTNNKLIPPEEVMKNLNVSIMALRKRLLQVVGSK